VCRSRAFPPPVSTMSIWDDHPSHRESSSRLFEESLLRGKPGRSSPFKPQGVDWLETRFAFAWRRCCRRVRVRTLKWKVQQSDRQLQLNGVGVSARTAQHRAAGLGDPGHPGNAAPASSLLGRAKRLIALQGNSAAIAETRPRFSKRHFAPPAPRTLVVRILLLRNPHGATTTTFGGLP
jgi:hypothetical protein